MERIDGTHRMWQFGRSEFVRDTAILTVGIGAAQVLSLLTAPLLTRVFSPASFGENAVFLALTAILVPLVSGSYASAIPLPKEDNEALQLARLSILFTLIATPLASLVIFSAISGAAWLRLTRIELYLLPLAVLASSALQTGTYWALRSRAFSRLSYARVLGVAIAAASQLALGNIFGPSGMSLVIGGMVGVFGCALITSPHALYSRPEKMSGIFSTQNRAIARRYSAFPLFLSIGSLLDSLAVQLVPILLASIVSTELAGLYSLASIALAVPLAFFGKSIGQVFFQRMASLGAASGDLAQPTARTFLILVFAALPVMSALFLFGPELFTFVFGEPWRDAGKIIRILLPLFFFQFLANPLSSLLLVKKRVSLLTLIQAMLLLSTVLPFVLGSLFKIDPWLVLVLYSAMQSAVYVAYVTLILFAGGVSLAILANELNRFSTRLIGSAAEIAPNS